MPNEKKFQTGNGGRRNSRDGYDRNAKNGREGFRSSKFKLDFDKDIRSGRKSESSFGKPRKFGNRNERFAENKEERFAPKFPQRARRNDDERFAARKEHNVYSKKKQLEYKKAFVDFNAPIRLNRFIANSGVCSRREADEYILAGVITVNGEVVTELGTKIVPTRDKVLFHDQLLRSEKKVYVLLNKPKDCVTTTDDPHARLTVLDIVKNACAERIYPVGRLDRNTTGVLLLTNDGELATVLTHPKFNKKKVYQATLDKPISQDDIQKLLDGIVLEDGEIHADEIAYVGDDHRQVGIEIHSGRNRIIRRMFEHIGYTVKQLDRSVFAGLTKKNLPRGKWRFLSEKEVAVLKMGAFE